MMGLAIVQAPFTLLRDCRQISHALLFMLHYRQVLLLSHLYGLWFGSVPSRLVIALHLIMSGDVELNPGPLDQGGLAI